MLSVNKYQVKKAKERTQEKIEFWKRNYPTLQFDEWGRARVSEKNEKTYDVEGYIKMKKQKSLKPTKTFMESFYEAMAQHEIIILDGDEPRAVTAKCPFKISELEMNKVTVYDANSDQVYETKCSKLLAKAQKVWLEKTPKYNEVKEKMKEQRQSGIRNYRKLIKVLRIMEINNLYFDYQRITNKGKISPVFLTVNPLDWLTLAGGDDHLTKFNTCISNTMEINENSVDFSFSRTSSDPKMAYYMGSLMNSGIIYQPNTSKAQVGNTEFAFMGYTKRTKVFLDKGIVYIDRTHPVDFSSEEMKAINLRTIFHNGYDEQDYTEVMDYQDEETLMKIVKYLVRQPESRYYLDRFAINENAELILLPTSRANYSNSGKGVFLPYFDETYSVWSYTDGVVQQIMNETLNTEKIAEALRKLKKE